ncbi:MAG: efflux RND transporter periplasmic adaptor subunit [Nitrospirae bacterium]|nr:efflux RND transporter periplasmic adaptor subunit [Nitrospirota bacterium]
MKNSNRLFWIMIVVAVAAAAAWNVTHRGKNGATRQEGSGGPRVLPVEAAPVQVGPVSQEIETVGTLQANESVVIRSEIAGRISGIDFSEGQAVQDGSVLLRIDPAEYKAQADQAGAVLQLNQMNYDRARQLNEEKLLSPQAYDEIVAKLKESQANLALFQARLDKTTIRAPFSGRLGLRLVSPGGYVQPGQAIVNLEDIGAIKVDFRIPEVYLGRVHAGQTVNLQVDAMPERMFEGQIYAIDPRIDDASRTILLRAHVPNPRGDLRPGMFARVKLVLARHTNAILIPEQALVPMGQDKFVYHIVDGKAALAKIKIGRRLEGLVEIVEGLSANDTVVTGGQTKLFKGAPVMVMDPSSAKPELPAAAKP